MTAEILSKRVLIDEASVALSRLDVVKASLVEQHDLALPRDKFLEQALENLHFVEDNISTVVNGFFTKTHGRLSFGYKTFSLLGEVPIMFTAQEDQAHLSYAFDPRRKPTRLTEELVTRLWNANINRDAVKAFGSLSKEQVLQKFESHILTSVK